MSAKDNRFLKKFTDSIKQTEKKTSGYDTSATVRRIENGVAWVHIPGGVDETPVKLTINANVGDDVQIRVVGGRAFMVGNASAPPTDDKTANVARNMAQVAEKKANEAEQTAEQSEAVATQAIVRANAAKKIADDTSQYFWFLEKAIYKPTEDVTVVEGKAYYYEISDDEYEKITPIGTENPSQEGWFELVDSTGAHITEVPKEEFLADMKGGNLLARSNGIAVRDGVIEVAQFSDDSVVIGEANKQRLIIENSGMAAYNADNVSFFDVDYYGSNIVEIKGYTRNEQVGYILCPEYDRSFVFDGTLDLPTIVDFTFTCKAHDSDTFTSVDRKTNNITYTLSEKDLTINVNGINLANIDEEKHASLVLVTSISTMTIGFDFIRDKNHIYVNMYFDSRSEIRLDNVIMNGWAQQTLSTKSPSFYFGYNTTAQKGAFSSSFGRGLDTSGANQTVLGKYNKRDAANAYAFIVGNGMSDAIRSNAFTVDWLGNAWAKNDIEAEGSFIGTNGTFSGILSSENLMLLLDTTATTGIDKEIYDALVELGWDSDVIV